MCLEITDCFFGVPMVDALDGADQITPDIILSPTKDPEPQDDLHAQVEEIKKNRPLAEIIQNGTKVCIISTGDRYSFGTVAPDR